MSVYKCLTCGRRWWKGLHPIDKPNEPKRECSGCAWYPHELGDSGALLPTVCLECGEGKANFKPTEPPKLVTTDYSEVEKRVAAEFLGTCSLCGRPILPYEVPRSTGLYHRLCERCQDND